MAKLRHIAIQVPDLEKAAAFYESVFGLTRLKKVEAPIGNAISLSDGVVNLTLLQFPAGTQGGNTATERVQNVYRQLLARLRREIGERGASGIFGEGFHLGHGKSPSAAGSLIVSGR